MRKLLVLGLLVSSSLAAVGCGLLKKSDADAGLDASDVDAGVAPEAVADAGVPPAAAKNAAEVARFGTETAMSEAAKTLSVASARTIPKAGAVVTALKAGSDVTKVAHYQDDTLVMFSDPKDATATLMGWVSDAAFGPSTYVAPKTDAGAKDGGAKTDAGAVVDAGPAVVDAGKGPLTCAAGSEAVILSSTAPSCHKRCVADKDCKGGAAGTCSNASAVKGGVVRICTTE